MSIHELVIRYLANFKSTETLQANMQCLFLISNGPAESRGSKRACGQDRTGNPFFFLALQKPKMKKDWKE